MVGGGEVLGDRGGGGGGGQTPNILPVGKIVLSPP